MGDSVKVFLVLDPATGLTLARYAINVAQIKFAHAVMRPGDQFGSDFTIHFLDNTTIEFFGNAEDQVPPQP